MRFHLPSFLLSALLLILSLLLSACGVSEPTYNNYQQQPVATAPNSSNAPKSTISPDDFWDQVLAGMSDNSVEYLPPYGCLPAITITSVVVQACIDKPEPAQYETLQITTRMSKDGLPIASAPIKTTWDFKTGKIDCRTTSNAAGIGFCYENIGTAEIGSTVIVEVQFDYAGRGYRGETSFTPNRPGNLPAPTSKPAPAKPPLQFIYVEGGAPGDYAGVEVQTAPNAYCVITYLTPHGTESTAAGLVDKWADGAGLVSWSWKIGTNTYPGTGDIFVTCDRATINAPITID